MTAGEALSMMDAGDRLTPDQLAALMPLVRQAMKDKRYRDLPMGAEAERYLRSKRKRLTDTSYRGYEGCLDKLARHYPDLELEAFELPAGAELVEEFLDERWGAAEPGTYNVNLSILSDFFTWHVKRGRMRSNPCTLVDRAKKREIHRTTFSSDQQREIIASAELLRDRIALRLLLNYALRKGTLQQVQFKHFDHQRKRLTLFMKGKKVRTIPLPEPSFWMDLEWHILDEEAQPNHYLMCLVKPIPYGSPNAQGKRETRPRRFPDRMMSSTAMHRWWYARLNDAGIVAKGTTAGEHMHKARHTAGQRLLDHSGNLKAVQKLLGHESISTTADVYVDWDLDQLSASLEQALKDDA